MAISQIIKIECKTCGKIAVEQSRFTLGKTTLIRLACGHSLAQATKVQEQSVYDSIIFSDGAKPREYQIDAVKFLEANNFNGIIADEQGLGKTIELLCTIRLHPAELLPAVFVVPTSVKVQWLHEAIRICGFTNPTQFLTQVIASGKEKAMPGFQIYVTTYEMLKKDDIFSLIPEGTIKTLMLDECQRIKNHLSERAKAVQKLAKKCQNIIPMSGTPIKNHAGEYFTILNLVDPIRFNNYQRYLDRYCDYYDNGYALKIGGLKNPDQFHEDTKHIILRRTKADKLPGLPEKSRNFYHVELDRKLNKAYAEALKELDELMYSEDGFEKNSATIAIMSKMRHITGISKVSQCVDFVTEFLLSSDRKIVIFTHHVDVSQLLENNLNSYLTDGGFGKVLMMHSGLNGDKRAELAKTFKEDSNARVMIASTLAAGEGLNLQFCSDAVMLERQWNPANEEQAEDRFHRFGQTNTVTITYMLASGTIDEYFTELVEVKRSIVASTMDNKQIQWEQSSLMKDLTEMLLTKDRGRWRL